MAHTCYSFTDPLTESPYYIIKAKASAIKLTNFCKNGGDANTLRATKKYGMNCAFFNPNNNRLSSLVYQNGSPVGMDSNDGRNNTAGGCIIAYNNGSLYFAANVNSDASSKVPKGIRNTWAIGGMGLYLGHPDWLEMFLSNPEARNYFENETLGPRTALLANTDTNEVYLVACFILTTTINNMRLALMSYADIEEGTYATTPWRAILLDGGASAQIRGKNFNHYTTIKNRAVPQIIEVT